MNLRRNRIPVPPNWQRFSVERASETSTAASWLVDNFFSATLSMPATNQDLVRFICASAQRSIPAISLCDELRETSLTRGRVCFGMPGKLIDEVAMKHPGVEWWITDAGLSMEVVPPASAVPELDRFDQILGPLIAAEWKEQKKRNTSLPKETLADIGIRLDAEAFKLNAVLQPAQWEALKFHNQKAGRAAIKNFQQLAASRYSYMLRRRLYPARKNYMTALEAVMPFKRELCTFE